MLDRGHQFQHQRRPADDLAPPALVGRPCRPPVPPRDGRVERRPRLDRVERPVRLFGRDFQRHRRLVAGFEPHGPAHIPIRFDQRKRRPQPQLRSVRVVRAEGGTLAPHLDTISAGCVGRAGRTPHLDVEFAAYDADVADDPLRAAVVRHRHEVGHLGDAFLGQEPGQQHVGVRHVHLDRAVHVLLGADREPAGGGVEQAREDGGPVERAGAEERDRAVAPDQRRRSQVADDAVVVERDGLPVAAARRHAWLH